MEIVVRNPLIAHHLIPWSLQENKLIQKAAEGFAETINGVVSHDAFHINEYVNGFAISAAQHGPGGHLLYNITVENKLTNLFNQLTSNGNVLTPKIAVEKVRNLIYEIQATIVNNPSLNLDQIAALL